MLSLQPQPASKLTIPLSAAGAIDMDVYGAFQLCSLGILAAPVTVKLSRTYFEDPGRNTIFLWTILILAGEPEPDQIYRQRVLTNRKDY